MGERTGRPRGRPPGAKNKRTEEREEAMKAAADVIAESLPAAFTGDAHALLMSVYKDQTQPIDLRVDAAKAAIRYEKPALAAVTAQHSGPDGGPIRTVTEHKPDLSGLTAEDLYALDGLAEKLARQRPGARPN